MIFMKLTSYTIQKRDQIVELFYEKQCSVENELNFIVDKIIHLQTIARIIKEFKRSQWPQIKKIENIVVAVVYKNIDMDLRSVAEDHEITIRRCSQVELMDPQHCIFYTRI